MSTPISELRCLDSVCGSCKAEVARITNRFLCPHCNVGEFEKRKEGPAQTFICNHCGAIALPGRKA